MDTSSLSNEVAGLVSGFLAGMASGVGTSAGQQAFTLVSNHLRQSGGIDSLRRLEDYPGGPEEQNALAAEIRREMDRDGVFREALERAVRSWNDRSTNSPGNVSADRRGRAAGRDYSETRTTSFGGLTTTVIAVVAVVAVLLLSWLGRTIFVQLSGGSAGSGLDGSSTCREYLAATSEDKAAVMKQLFLAEGKTQSAADPFIVQNADYACGLKPDRTLGSIASSRAN